VNLDRSPRQAWFAAAAPVRTALKKNNKPGGDRYDPAEVDSCTLSVFGGGATLYIDDLALSPANPLAVPEPR
jgi:hypothetical protein